LTVPADFRQLQAFDLIVAAMLHSAELSLTADVGVQENSGSSIMLVKGMIRNVVYGAYLAL